MSRTPFSRPDVDDIVSGSHVFKKRFSLNNRLRARLPEARVKHLFGIVTVALFLLGSQLTACGYSAGSSTGSASPTSNTTSIPNTPGSRSGPGSTSTAGPTTHPTVVPTTNPTAGPTTQPTTIPTTNPTARPTTDPTAGPTADPTAGPTTDPTAIPTADPTSFTVTEAGITYAFIGTVGQSDAQIDPTNSDFGSPYIDVTYGNPNSSTPAGPIDWSVSANQNWIELDPSDGSLRFGSPLRVNIKVSIPQGMQAGTYTGKIVFSPNTSGNNHDDVKLTVVPVYVSSISPTSGPAAGGTSVTVRGSGFTGASGVSFGATPASNIMVNSDTKITATSPAGSGTVDVTVTTLNGTSATGGADQFTYIPTPTAVPTPTPTAVPTPTSMPSETAHNRFLFRY